MFTRAYSNSSRWLSMAVVAVLIFVLGFSGLGLMVGHAQTGEPTPDNVNTPGAFPSGIVPSASTGPYIDVEKGLGIFGLDWTPDTTVTLTIDDPANGTGVDYTESILTPISQVSFYLEGQLLKAGNIVTLTDGSTTKSVVISSVEILTVDWQSDTVSGTAEPGGIVILTATPPDAHITNFTTQVTADMDGKWFIDLKTGAQPYDIVQGTSLGASIYDEDGDFAKDSTYVPNPKVKIDLTFDTIEAYVWPAVGPITLTVDDPSNGIGIDYTQTVDRGGNPYLYLDLQGVYDLASGQTIVLTDGVYIETVKPDVSLDPVLPWFMTPTGTAAPGSEVDVRFEGPKGGISLRVTADSNGNWSTSFLPYDWIDYSVGPGTGMTATGRDEDGNYWTAYRNIPYPQIGANLTLNSLTEWDWSMGTVLTVTVDDPTNDVGVDFSRTSTIGGVEEDPQGRLDFGDFQLAPGQLITATDGETARELIVPGLAVTSIDMDNDVVSGTAAPGSELTMYEIGYTGVYSPFQDLVADTDGLWSVQFMTDLDHVDVKPGTLGRVQQSDDDGDLTMVDWIAGNPTISAVSPLNILAGSTDMTLTVTGSVFAEFSVVNWNGTPLPTTYINPTLLTAKITDTDVANIGSTQITVSNPVTGESNAVQVNIVTFADVVPTAWYYRYVEGFYAQGITAGCGTSPMLYCPDRGVTRAQMAVFLLNAKGVVGADLPAATGMFSDVPTNFWAAKYIEELARQGITSGCVEGLYCPDKVVTRAQMAVFLLLTKHGTDFVPPAPTGVFSDVPTDYWAAKWIEELAREGITSGCGAGVFCPAKGVTRAQMAVFMDAAFGYPPLP